MSQPYDHMKQALSAPPAASKPNSSTPKPTIIPTHGVHGWSHPRPPEDNPRPIQHNRRVSRDAEGNVIMTPYDDPIARRRDRVSMPASFEYPARSLRQTYETLYGPDLAAKLIANADFYQYKHRHFIDQTDIRSYLPDFSRRSVERKVPVQGDDVGAPNEGLAFYIPSQDSILINTNAIPFNAAIYPDQEFVNPIPKNQMHTIPIAQTTMLHEGIHSAQDFDRIRLPYAFFRPTDAADDWMADYPTSTNYVNQAGKEQPFAYSRFVHETAPMVAQTKFDYFKTVVNPKNQTTFDEELMNFNNPESYQKFLNWASKNPNISWMTNPKELSPELRDLFFRGVAENSATPDLNPELAGSLNAPTKMAADKKLLDQTSELAQAVIDPTSEESLFRDAYYDLKRQHLGPSFLNTQRLYEIGDSLLYQGMYGLPAAALGGVMAGPVGAAAGLGIGGKAGTVHAAIQELERLKAARREFTKSEKRLLNRLSKSFKNWATASAIIGGAGGAGLGYSLAPEEGYQKYLAAALAGLGGAVGLGFLGGLTGRGIERERLRSLSKYRKLIDHYD